MRVRAETSLIPVASIAVVLAITGGLMGYPEFLLPVCVLVLHLALWTVVGSVVASRVRVRPQVTDGTLDCTVGASVPLLATSGFVGGLLQARVVADCERIPLRRVTSGGSEINSLSSESEVYERRGDGRTLDLAPGERRRGLRFWVLNVGERQAIKVVAVSVHLKDPFSLLAWARRADIDFRVFATPVRAGARLLESPAESVRSDGTTVVPSSVGEISHLRPYDPSDDSRRINWGAFARDPERRLVVLRTVDDRATTLTVVLHCDSRAYSPKRLGVVRSDESIRLFESAVALTLRVLEDGEWKSAFNDSTVELLVVGAEAHMFASGQRVERRAIAAVALEDAMDVPDLPELAGGACVLVSGPEGGAARELEVCLGRARAGSIQTMMVRE